MLELHLEYHLDELMESGEIATGVSQNQISDGKQNFRTSLLYDAILTYIGQSGLLIRW